MLVAMPGQTFLLSRIMATASSADRPRDSRNASRFSGSEHCPTTALPITFAGLTPSSRVAAAFHMHWSEAFTAASISAFDAAGEAGGELRSSSRAFGGGGAAGVAAHPAKAHVMAPMRTDRRAAEVVQRLAIF